MKKSIKICFVAIILIISCCIFSYYWNLSHTDDGSQEIIVLNGVKFRNLGNIDGPIAYNKSNNQYWQINKNPKDIKKLSALLILFSERYFSEHDFSQYPELPYVFWFYRTTRKMPWNWDDNGKWDSLEGYPVDLIACFDYSNKGEIKSYSDMKKRSFLFNYGAVTDKKSFKKK